MVRSIGKISKGSIFALTFLLVGCSAKDSFVLKDQYSQAKSGYTNAEFSWQKISKEDWFKQGYQEYQPVQDKVNELKKNSKNVDLLVFGGSWCSDTRREIPHLKKILDQAGFKSDQVLLVHTNPGMTEETGIAEAEEVKSVPTIVVYVNGKKQDRIVESPEKTLEEDLVKIIQSAQ